MQVNVEEVYRLSDTLMHEAIRVAKNRTSRMANRESSDALFRELNIFSAEVASQFATALVEYFNLPMEDAINVAKTHELRPFTPLVENFKTGIGG